MINNEFHKEESSYRDNHGSVYFFKNKVLRTINAPAESNYLTLKKQNIYRDSIKNNFLIDFQEVEKNIATNFNGEPTAFAINNSFGSFFLNTGYA